MDGRREPIRQSTETSFQGNLGMPGQKTGESKSPTLIQLFKRTSAPHAHSTFPPEHTPASWEVEPHSECQPIVALIFSIATAAIAG